MIELFTNFISFLYPGKNRLNMSFEYLNSSNIIFDWIFISENLTFLFNLKENLLFEDKVNSSLKILLTLLFKKTENLFGANCAFGWILSK